MRQFTVDSRVIHDESDCMVIAEIGNNHQGSLEICKEMFHAAKECGADVVKLQKRDNHALYTQAFYDKPYESENSFGPTYGLHRDALEFGKAEYLELAGLAQELGLIFSCTAFDIPSADFLEEVGISMYKIASGDLRSKPLLEHVARKGKPMVVSTGGATMADVRRAYEIIKPLNPNFCLLQCTASYPADYEHLDLKVIDTFRQAFPEVVIGLSDHQNGISMAPVAYLLGARVIEKHFTMSHVWKGADHAFSLEPTGLRKLVRDLHRTRQSLGDGVKKIHPEEKNPIIKMSKKLVADRDLPVGHCLAGEDLTMKCPGDGISPMDLEQVVGRVLKQAVRKDDALSWEMI